MNISLFANELHFYESEGWTDEILQSCLDQGSVRLERTPGGCYYRLSPSDVPGSFSYGRLSEFAGDVIDVRGLRLDPKRRSIALKYCSTVGIFNFGDDSKWRR